MARQRSSTRDDFDRVKDTVQKLKGENRRLKKENAVLRKQLTHVSEFEFEKQIELENVEDLIIVPERKAEKKKCPKCKSEEIKELLVGKYLIKTCLCGYRRRTEVKLEG